MGVLSGLKPEKVFYYFEELSKIPHGSGNTKMASDWLVSFAQERGLEYYQDQLNDVIIIKEGSTGYENSEPVILQGHMDMVCEKNPGCTKDMAKEGLDLVVDGDVIRAKDTTLGGDDGMAVAMMMALLDDETIEHPRLECVFTVDEETGLYGAEAIDVSMLKGKKFINLDSEDEGIATISCAGGASSIGEFAIQREDIKAEALTVKISGLTGGHSGMEINKGLANANKLMGRLLFEISQVTETRIVAIDGGSADNVITKECLAVIMVEDEKAAKAVCREFEKTFMHEFKQDEGLKVETFKGEVDNKPMTAEDTLKIIAFTNCTPNGIEKMTEGIDGLPQTSLNLGVVKTEDEMVTFVFGVRSSVDSECHMICQRIKNFTMALGGKYTEEGNYPGWEYEPNSPLRDLVCEVFKEQYGKDMVIEAIHAGLECGFFSAKIPGLDCVSIGPDMRDVHTPNETIHIKSTERVWNMLLEVLRRMK